MTNLKILIPTDFDEKTNLAVDYAKNFNNCYTVDIIFLHVLELNAFVELDNDGSFNEMMGVNAEQLEIQKKEAVQKLTNLTESYKDDFNCVRSIIKFGPLTETILSVSEEEKRDMIVMGTGGSQGFKEWISGSETQIIARRSHIPVLTLMRDRQLEPVNNILFISDFSHIDVSPDPIIHKLALACNSKIHLLQITEDDNSLEKDQERMQSYAKNHGFENADFHVHHNKKVVDGINEFELMEEMNIIAIGTHGRRGFRSLIKGSIAEKLVNHLHKPVLVFKI